MAIDLEQYARLKKRAEKSRSDYDRAEGILSEHKKKLKEEFGVDTIEEAEELLTKLTNLREENERKYNEKLKEYEEKWGKI